MDMKDFMMLFIGAGSDQELGLSPEQMQERMGKWMAWDAAMRQKGQVKEGNALLPTGVTLSGLDMKVTDRPLAEGKEIVGGYYVIRAKDLKEAAEIAKGFPDFDLGSRVEIRDIMVFDHL
jgi:hypothetical protein